MKIIQKSLLVRSLILVVICVIMVCSISACDKINNANRTFDTMLGGDFEVHIQGHSKVYYVKNGKVTSVPEKGYYIFYPTVNGKKQMVQSPIQLTTIIQTN